MTKREKQEQIISHLQILRTWCAISPDFGKGLSIDDCHKAVEWLDDALDLLKAREPKPPTIKENSYGWKFYYCPSCGKKFYQNNKFSFCERCGQAVNEND